MVKTTARMPAYLGKGFRIPTVASTTNQVGTDFRGGRANRKSAGAMPTALRAAVDDPDRDNEDERDAEVDPNCDPDPPAPEATPIA